MVFLVSLIKKHIVPIVILLIFFGFIGCGENKNNEVVVKHYDDSELELTENELLFRALVGKKYGVFKYSLSDSSVHLVWNDYFRDVLSVSPSKDHSSYFIISALTYGNNGALPFITNVRLHLYSANSGKIKTIQNFGDVVQIHTMWQGEIFYITTNRSNSKSGTIIEQTISLYDNEGMFLKNDKKSYDIIKEGYPSFPDKKINANSPDGNFSIRVVEGSEPGVVLTNRREKSEALLFDTKASLRSIEWSNNSGYVSLIVENTTTKKWQLKMFNTESKKEINSFASEYPIAQRNMGKIIAYQKGQAIEFYNFLDKKGYSLSGGKIKAITFTQPKL